ncbi:hypothetical protein ACVIGA_001558 [Bradyrhizobium sp. USDA 3240]
MQVSKCIGIILLWIAGFGFVLAGVNSNDPYLVPLRGTGNLLVVVASIAVAFVLVRSAASRRRAPAGKLLVILWCLPPLAMLAAHGVFEVRKHRVLRTEPVLARSLGQHFVIGYRSSTRSRRLWRRGSWRASMSRGATSPAGRLRR